MCWRAGDRSPCAAGHRGVTAGAWRPQAAVSIGHSEIKMATGCHGKRATETGSAKGQDKQEVSRACSLLPNPPEQTTVQGLLVLESFD